MKRGLVVPQGQYYLSAESCLEADTEFSAKASFHYIKKRAEGYVLSVVFYFGDIGAFFTYTLGELFLRHIEPLARTSYLKTYAQCFKFIFKSVTLWCPDFAVVFGFELIKSLYVFHLSLFLSFCKLLPL